MYAARKQGFTAVPVIQGIAAVVTIAMCLGSPCRLLKPLCNLGGMLSYIYRPGEQVSGDPFSSKDDCFAMYEIPCVTSQHV